MLLIIEIYKTLLFLSNLSIHKYVQLHYMKKEIIYTGQTCPNSMNNHSATANIQRMAISSHLYQGPIN